MPEASGLRFGVNGERTRIVIDLDRQVSFAVGQLEEPTRLVVDLDEVRWNLRPTADTRPRGMARAYRHGLLQPGKSRLVVDMSAPFTVSRAMLLPPSGDSRYHRLVVDVVAAVVPRKPPVPPVTAAAPPAAAAPVVVATPRPKPSLETPVDPPPVETAALEPVLPEAKPLPPPLDAELEGTILEPPVEAPAEAAPPAPVVPHQLPVVVIDPGHGGIDPGAIGVNGVYEKDIVLQMGRELRDLLNATGRYRAVLTRDDDTFIRLRDRIAIAREAGGQIFISLHADSIRTAEQRGASVYTLSETASDEEAARLAGAENKADILTGADLSQHDEVVATILIDLAQRDTNNKSIAFADVLAEELSAATTLIRRHRRFAGFAVLKSPDIPSVLLEMGYLSNQSDAQNLAAADYRANIGRSILRALDRHFTIPPI